MDSSLSIVNVEQNYQTILTCVKDTPINTLVTDVVLGKISLLSKPASLGYQVNHSKFEFNYSLLAGLSISGFAPFNPPVGLALTAIIGAASVVHTGFKWVEKRQKETTSKNIALLMTPIFSDLNKYINHKMIEEFFTTAYRFNRSR